MTDFSRMDVGEGPGDTLRRLTELQKAPVDQRDSPNVDQRMSAVPPSGTSSTSDTTPPSPSDSAKTTKSKPANSRNANSPTGIAAKKTQKERGKKAQKAKSPSGSSETASSKATVVSEVPPANPSEPSRKEDPQSKYMSQLDDIVARLDDIAKDQATKNSMASSSGATTLATPVQTAKTEAPPIPAPSPSKSVPPLENTVSGESAVSRQASTGQTRPAVALPASTTGKGTSSSDAQYRIGREDVLFVTVWGNVQLTMDVIVRPDGKISFPLIQDIQAEGFTASELSDQIHDKLLPYIKDPNVSVIVKQINAPKFSVIGYVNRPGTFPMRGDVTVLQALSEAGGFTPFASPRKIKLVRNAGGKQEIRVFNYYDLIDKGGDGSFLLKAGDTIVVP
jgi:polysaccharide export outer membrane protein